MSHAIISMYNGWLHHSARHLFTHADEVIILWFRCLVSFDALATESSAICNWYILVACDMLFSPHLSGPHTHYTAHRSYTSFHSASSARFIRIEWKCDATSNDSISCWSKQWTLGGHRTRNERNDCSLVAHFTIKFNSPEATKCSTIHNVQPNHGPVFFTQYYYK